MSMTLRAEFTSASSAEHEMRKKRKKNSICYIEEELPSSQYSFLHCRSVLYIHAIRDFDFITSRDSVLKLGKIQAKNV